jgi:peptide deformylase
MQDKHRLILYPDTILRKKTDFVDRLTPQIKDFIETMKHVCSEKKGLGIAAPQVNESVSIFVTPMIGNHIKTKDPLLAKDFADWNVFINPKILSYSKEAVAYEEGCLSLPKLFCEVFRPKSIEVEYYDQNFEIKQKYLSHWFARLFLHEYDHLQGILFTDYILGMTSNGFDQTANLDDKIRISKFLTDLEKGS